MGEGKVHLDLEGESARRIDESQKKYIQSEKGKESKAKYEQSPRGREAWTRHTKTEKYKLTQRRYRASPKGRDIISNRREIRRNLSAMGRWLKENPDRTIEDYFATEDVE